MALSRVKTLEQLFLTGEFNAKHIRADPRVHEEYERLRSPSLRPVLEDVLHTTGNDNSIIITLLSICSLKKHSIDIKFDRRIIHSDILAFTETQVRPVQAIQNVEEILCDFCITRHDNCNSYLSKALCTRKELSQSDHIVVSIDKWVFC